MTAFFMSYHHRSAEIHSGGAGRVQKVQRVQRGQRVAVSPSRAILMKSALRDWLSSSYIIVSILVISRCAAPPYPATPDFPPSGGQNKTPRNTLFINGSTVSTGYSAPACGGKVVAPATKGGLHFLARRAVVWFSPPKAV